MDYVFIILHISLTFVTKITATFLSCSGDHLAPCFCFRRDNLYLKVMFSQASVSHSVHRGCCTCLLSGPSWGTGYAWSQAPLRGWVCQAVHGYIRRVGGYTSVLYIPGGTPKEMVYQREVGIPGGKVYILTPPPDMGPGYGWQAISTHTTLIFWASSHTVKHWCG